MSVMSVLKRLSENKKEQAKRYKEIESEYNLQKKLEERQKSANLREYENYIKEKEEAEIKRRLDIIRKKRNKEAWKPKHSILKKEKSILKDDRPILKEKNIFSNNKNIFRNGGNMFF